MSSRSWPPGKETIVFTALTAFFLIGWDLYHKGTPAAWALSALVVTAVFLVGLRSDWAHRDLERLEGSLHEEVEKRTSELSATARSLERSEATTRALLAAMPDMLFRLDRDGVVRDYPSADTRDLILTPEEFVGRRLREVMPAPIADQTERAIAAALDTGRIQIFEYELPGEHGPQKFEARIVRRDAEEALAIVRNVTDARLAEEEKERLQEKMLHAQKLESLGVLAGGIAHDFNNLLTGIIGNASLARMSLAEGTSPEECVVQIETAALRAAELTNQMLAYSGKAFYSVKPVDLSELVGETVPLLRTALASRAAMSPRLAEDLPPVMADQGQIRQVIMNLVLNASEALGDEGGIISISTRLLRPTARELERSALAVHLPAGEYVCLEVKDNGAGMTQEVQARIFEPFYTTKFLGRGLGLSAVIGIVRGHDGALIVESAPGEGTCMRVLLPAADVAQVKTGIGKSAVSMDPGIDCHGTILVIDDEKIVLDVARQSLERAGFTVVGSTSGREGVELFRRDPDSFRAVLLDMTLPDLNGKEVFRRIRRIRGEAVVIMTSGHAEEAATRRFSREELTAFIEKPYNPENLLEKIRQVLSHPA